MKRTITVFVLILLCTIVPVPAQNSVDELNPVLRVLYEAHLSGSIELVGRCDPLQLPAFSQFARTTVAASSPLATLREIIASDPGMKVKQDADGTIRMLERGVPSDILNIRISHIVFQDYAHRDIHSANLAVRVILSSPEVQSFIATHDMVAPQLNGGGGSMPYGAVEAWPPESPHIAGSLDNITVSEALDRVINAFRGEVLVYWDCPATHRKTESNRTKTSDKQGEQLSSSMNCPTPASFPKDAPNPLCMPSLDLSKLPQLFTPTEPSHQRRVFFLFWAMKLFDGKILVVSG